MKPSKKLQFPWFTALITFTVLAVYSLFMYWTAQAPNKAFVYSDIGAPYAIQIYMGQYWGVFTNSFLHINPIHLGINIVALWVFGAYLERRIGWFNYFLLGLFASVTTSMIQLTLTYDAGVGLSGINFFFAFFIMGRSFLSTEYRRKGNMYVSLLIVLLLGGAFYVNYTGYYLMGIEAILSGAALGIVFGWLTSIRYRTIAAMAFILVLASTTTTLFHAPWSAEWHYYKGYQAQLALDYATAKKSYRKALEIDPSHKVSRENLFIIAVEELSELAIQAHERENYVLAKKYYRDLLKMDPHNSWAKDNLKLLP